MSEVTALTGSSPAYVFMFIEAMADAAVRWGYQDKAYRFAAQAVWVLRRWSWKQGNTRRA